jgi:hypothetical protein
MEEGQLWQDARVSAWIHAPETIVVFGFCFRLARDWKLILCPAGLP